MEKSIDIQKDKNKNKNKNLKSEKLTKISKQITYILRHKAKDFGLSIEPSGFVKLDDLLNVQMIKSHKLTLDMVKEIVDKDSKQRFSLENRPPYYIRANQGHSIDDVKNEECLEMLSNYGDFQCVVHGTNREAWEKIQLSGLNKMNRNCIHFAIGYPKDKEVISGMRVSCDVFVEVDIIRAVENQIPFYISGNKVILTPGLNGILPFDYFLLVKTSKNATLYAQKYDYVVNLIFQSNNPNQIETILIIDLIQETVIKGFNFTDLSVESEIFKLNKLIDYLIENKLFKEKIIISFNQKNIENFKNIITSNLNYLRYKSFFMIYITVKKDLNQKEILTHFVDNKAILTSENAERLLITSGNNTKTEDNNQLNGQMNQSKMIIDGTNKAINFNGKIFLMLDAITFEDSDTICCIDYIVFKPEEFDKSIRISCEFDSKSNKDNLTNLIENLDNTLSGNNINKEDLFTIIEADVLERIKRMAKQILIRLPKYFVKNLMIFDKNHIEFSVADLNDKAKVFLLEYLNNPQKLNTIKLIN